MEIIIAIVAVAFVALLIPLLYRRVVPTNEVHIVQTSKQTLAYGKDTENGNVYYQWPSWIPVLGIEVKSLPVSNFNIRLNKYDAFDKGRIPFLVDIEAFFRIADHAVAAQRVASIEELEDQLTSIVKGSVRSILAKSEIEEIMEERSVFGKKFTEEVKEQLKSWGIETVKNIELMHVLDAPNSNVIENITEKKQSEIETESRLVVAENKRKAEMAEIEARREVELTQKQALEQVGLRNVEVQQKIAIAEENKKQVVTEQMKATVQKQLEIEQVENTKKAEIEKEVALVEANKAKEVQLVRANQEKEVAKLLAEKEKEAGVIKAEADLQVKTKQAEADFEVVTKKAQALLVQQENNAKGIELEGLAKAKSEEALLMAPVNAQTTLAKEIGENDKYQQYLITVEQVKANKEVGIAQAAALSKAQIKVLANGGNASEGLTSVGELLTAKGGAKLGNMLEGLANTDVGQAVLTKVLK